MRSKTLLFLLIFEVIVEQNAQEKEHTPKPYAFFYEVNDPLSGNKYSHGEENTGEKTVGEFRVLLPDTRTKIVKYIATHEDGFEANVSYIGDMIESPPPRIDVRTEIRPRGSAILLEPDKIASAPRTFRPPSSSAQTKNQFSDQLRTIQRQSVPPTLIPVVLTPSLTSDVPNNFPLNPNDRALFPPNPEVFRPFFIPSLTGHRFTPESGSKVKLRSTKSNGKTVFFSRSIKPRLQQSPVRVLKNSLTGRASLTTSAPNILLVPPDRKQLSKPKTSILVNSNIVKTSTGAASQLKSSGLQTYQATETPIASSLANNFNSRTPKLLINTTPKHSYSSPPAKSFTSATPLPTIILPKPHSSPVTSFAISTPLPTTRLQRPSYSPPVNNFASSPSLPSTRLPRPSYSPSVKSFASSTPLPGTRLPRPSYSPPVNSFASSTPLPSKKLPRPSYSPPVNSYAGSTPLPATRLPRPSYSPTVNSFASSTPLPTTRLPRPSYHPPVKSFSSSFPLPTTRLPRPSYSAPANSFASSTPLPPTRLPRPSYSAPANSFASSTPLPTTMLPRPSYSAPANSFASSTPLPPTRLPRPSYSAPGNSFISSTPLPTTRLPRPSYSAPANSFASSTPLLTTRLPRPSYSAPANSFASSTPLPPTRLPRPSYSPPFGTKTPSIFHTIGNLTAHYSPPTKRISTRIPVAHQTVRRPQPSYSPPKNNIDTKTSTVFEAHRKLKSFQNPTVNKYNTKIPTVFQTTRKPKPSYSPTIKKYNTRTPTAPQATKQPKPSYFPSNSKYTTKIPTVLHTKRKPKPSYSPSINEYNNRIPTPLQTTIKPKPSYSTLNNNFATRTPSVPQTTGTSKPSYSPPVQSFPGKSPTVFFNTGTPKPSHSPLNNNFITRTPSVILTTSKPKSYSFPVNEVTSRVPTVSVITERPKESYSSPVNGFTNRNPALLAPKAPFAVSGNNFNRRIPTVLQTEESPNPYSPAVNALTSGISAVYPSSEAPPLQPFSAPYSNTFSNKVPTVRPFIDHQNLVSSSPISISSTENVKQNVKLLPTTYRPNNLLKPPISSKPYSSFPNKPIVNVNFHSHPTISTNKPPLQSNDVPALGLTTSTPLSVITLPATAHPAKNIPFDTPTNFKPHFTPIAATTSTPLLDYQGIKISFPALDKYQLNPKPVLKASQIIKPNQASLSTISPSVQINSVTTFSPTLLSTPPNVQKTSKHQPSLVSSLRKFLQSSPFESTYHFRPSFGPILPVSVKPSVITPSHGQPSTTASVSLQSNYESKSRSVPSTIHPNTHTTGSPALRFRPPVSSYPSRFDNIIRPSSPAPFSVTSSLPVEVKTNTIDFGSKVTISPILSSVKPKLSYPSSTTTPDSYVSSSTPLSIPKGAFPTPTALPYAAVPSSSPPSHHSTHKSNAIAYSSTPPPSSIPASNYKSQTSVNNPVSLFTKKPFFYPSPLESIQGQVGPSFGSLFGQPSVVGNHYHYDYSGEYYDYDEDDYYWDDQGDDFNGLVDDTPAPVSYSFHSQTHHDPLPFESRKLSSKVSGSTEPPIT